MSTKVCPYCAEEIKEAAVKCRFCGTMLGPRPGAGEWHRDLENKMLGGVSAGLARQFGISATAIRIAFIVSTFVGGWGLLIYLALWIIMPVAPASAEATPPALPPTPETGQDEK